MNKKFVSVVLSICMLVCLVPVVQVSAAECFLDKEMFNSSDLFRCERIKMSPEVPSEIKSDLFNLNKSGSVVGYIEQEGWHSSGWFAPRNPGDTVCLPENSERFFAYNLSGIEEMDLRGLDTSHVTNMKGMFRCAFPQLESLDLSSFNTANVTDMESMFHGCHCLTSLDLSSFSTSRVCCMHKMFLGCESLKRLDISRFNMDNVYNIEDMLNFGLSTEATVIYCSDKIWKRISSKESGLPSTAKHAAYIDERMLCDALRLKISDDGVTKIAVANRVPFGTDGVMPLNKEGSYLCYVEKGVFYIAPNRRVALTSIPPVGLPLSCDSMLRGFEELTEIDLSGIDRY